MVLKQILLLGKATMTDRASQAGRAAETRMVAAEGEPNTVGVLGRYALEPAEYHRPLDWANIGGVMALKSNYSL